jgi:phage terminase large subunit-like protein
MGIGMKTDGWAGVEFWQQAEDDTITLDTLIERCEVIIPGVDGGGLDDLYGLTLIGRERDTKNWLSWSHAWCHRGVLERRKSIASKLEEFAAAGELTIVDDKLEDHAAIVAIIGRVNETGLLGCVALDPEGPYGELVDALALIEITEEGEQIIGVAQGYKLMNAVKTTERKLANGTLRHAKSALMDWCVENVKIEATATAIRATKQNAGDAKIDPWAAMQNAATVMIRNPAARGASIFDNAAWWDAPVKDKVHVAVHAPG